MFTVGTPRPTIAVMGSRLAPLTAALFFLCPDAGVSSTHPVDTYPGTLPDEQIVFDARLDEVPCAFVGETTKPPSRATTEVAVINRALRV